MQKAAFAAVVLVQLRPCSNVVGVNKWLCTARNIRALCLFLYQRNDGGECTLSSGKSLDENGWFVNDLNVIRGYKVINKLLIKLILVPM